MPADPREQPLPVALAEQHRGEVLDDAGLDQHQRLEQLVERSEAAWEEDEAFGRLHEHRLPGVEVLEEDGDVEVGVCQLLARELDPKADGDAATLARAAVCSLHHARPSAGDDGEAGLGEEAAGLARLPVHGMGLGDPCGAEDRRSGPPDLLDRLETLKELVADLGRVLDEVGIDPFEDVAVVGARRGHVFEGTGSGPAADPLLAALVDLLLPERNCPLEPVYRLRARSERRSAMRRRDRDGDALLTDVDTADAVMDRDLAHVVLLPQAGGDLLHYLFGHAAVRLVLEVEDRAPAGLASGRADERGDRARPLIRHLGDHSVEVERRLGEEEGTAGHRRNQRDLVALGELSLARGVLTVDGIEQPGGLVAERERGPDVGDARAFGQVELALSRPRQLAQPRKQPDRDLHGRKRTISAWLRPRSGRRTRASTSSPSIPPA